MQSIDDAGDIDRCRVETGAVGPVDIGVDHGVVESADITDDGDRAVRHGLHLSQPARLETGSASAASPSPAKIL